MIGQKFQCLAVVSRAELRSILVVDNLLTSAFGVFSVWMKMVLLLTATGREDAVGLYAGWRFGRNRAEEDVMTGILEW